MKNFSITILFLGTLAMLAAAGGRAQSSGGKADVQQAVARISFLSGDVSYNRGDEPDAWQDAAVNVPMTLGDRLYLRGNGRAELQLQGGNFVRLGAQSDLSVLNLTDEIEQLSLQAGTASFDLSRLGNQESFEVDTPNIAVTFERAGDYRLDVDSEGNTRVAVRSGQALVAAGGGQVPLSAGSEMDITGIDSPQYDIVALPARDAWDGWVDQRGARFQHSASRSFVNAGVVGTEDLDQYGRWSDIPEYGHVWSPVSVEAGWQPYRAGRWGWQDPWGWTWIADEPWGWAPYHYGLWVNSSSRWFWVPVAPGAAYASYSPALVAFVGGGPGWSASFGVGGGGYMGWFPLAPRDPFVPWWGPRAGLSVNITNVTYVNRNFVTVINRDTFVSGGGVMGSYVRDPSVLRQVRSAPVLRGALPVMPAAGALRVSQLKGAAARPPAQVNARPVVTRLAPPPAPPSFQSKMAAIREQHGAPVTPAAAAQMSIKNNRGARALHPVRPAAAPSGAVTFRARSANPAGPQPQVLTAPRGKVLATGDRPLASTPKASTQQPLAPRGNGAPAPDRQRQVNNPPPARSFQAPPPRQDTGKSAGRQDRGQQQRLAPKGQAAPPPERPSPADQQQPRAQKQQRSFQEAPPPKAQDGNRAAPPDRRTTQPLAARGNSAPAPDRQKQVNNPPPARSFQAPPPRTRESNPQAAPERRQPQPQRATESRPTPQVNRSAPPPQRQASSPGDKGKQQKSPDTNKQKGKPATSSEPPPKTQ